MTVIDVQANSDGTVSVGQSKLNAFEASQLACDILMAASMATEKAGIMEKSKVVAPAEAINYARPNLIAAAPAPKGEDQRLIFVFGAARLGILVPTHIVAALGQNFLALSAPDRKGH